MKRWQRGQSDQTGPNLHPTYADIPSGYESLYGSRLNVMLGRWVCSGYIMDELLHREVEDLDPEHHYLQGSSTAAEAVILYGRFVPKAYPTASDERARKGRDLTVQAAKDAVREMLDESQYGRPLWGARWMANYFVLTGEKCWSPDEAETVKEDLGALIDKALAEGPYLPTSHAADYRLIFNEERWTSEQRDDMVRDALEQMNSYERTGVTRAGPLSVRAAAIRVLQAEGIRPVTGDKTRGIEIIDPPLSRS